MISAAFNAAPAILISMTGPDYEIAAVNEACRLFLGRTDLVGKPFRLAIPEITGQQIFALLDRVYATGRPETGREWRVQLNRGSGAIEEAFVDITVLPTRAANGLIAGLLGSGVDVTARVHNRLAAQQQADDAESGHLAAREVVSRLQAALLPSLPLLPRARIAARYLAAGRYEAAGGDWFDAIPLANGGVALIVGDVVGHGVAAAAAMAQLRAVLSELLQTESDLATALARVDKYASRTTALRAATLAVVVLEPSSGEVRYTTCGHPAPLTIGRDGVTRYLDASGNGPLGTGSPLVLAQARLEPGELLLLYSNGLIARPDRTLSASLAELATVAADAATNRVSPLGAAQSAPDRVCQLTVELLTRTGAADDVTALAVERLDAAVPPLRLEVPAEVTSLNAVRSALDGWLARLGAPADDRDGVHMAVVEIVTNAIEHAYPRGEPGPIRFEVTLRADGVLECVIADFGRWQAPDPAAADRGNGLMVAEHMMDSLQITHPAVAEGAAPGAPATAVTLLRRITRPAELASDFGAGVVAFQASNSFGVDVQLDGNISCAWVRGPVDHTTAGGFLRRLVAACRGGTMPLTVDLSGVTHLASVGVRALYQLANQLQRHGNNLELRTSMGSPAAVVLDLIGLPYQAA